MRKNTPQQVAATVRNLAYEFVGLELQRSPDEVEEDYEKFAQSLENPGFGTFRILGQPMATQGEFHTVAITVSLDAVNLIVTKVVVTQNGTRLGDQGVKLLQESLEHIFLQRAPIVG